MPGLGPSALLDTRLPSLCSDTVSCVHFFLPGLTYSMLSLWGQGPGSFLPSAPLPTSSPLPFPEHIYKEIVNFSPIARKDSRRRSGMKL